MANVVAPVRTPATKSGIPKRRLNPRAAPRNSARSVAMATASMISHMAQTAQRGNWSRQCSARFFPVAIPSLAERVWVSIAMRLLATITQSSM